MVQFAIQWKEHLVESYLEATSSRQIIIKADGRIQIDICPQNLKYSLSEEAQMVESMKI